MPRLGHDRLDDPPVSISRHLQQAADLLRRALVAEELLFALPDGRVLECESARAAEGGVQGGGEEARHGKVLRSFRVAGRFAARSDWQADLGDFEREVDRDVRTIALDDQGGEGADGEARRPVGEQGGRQARGHKASAVNFPSLLADTAPPRFLLLLRRPWRLGCVARTTAVARRSAWTRPCP